MSELERLAPPGTLERFSAEDLELIRRFVAPNSTDHELAFFLSYAQARGLNPFEGEVVGVSRWNSKEKRETMTIQTTVRGERTLAERTGLYGGQDPPQWCGADGNWLEVWLDERPPAAARVAVYRKDWERPAVGIARYSSYVQVNKDRQPVGLWRTAPDLMLAKCAEAAALRKAFSSGRDLSPAQRVSMEARQVGLDDDGRHALVAEVTDGRTSSTRDLTDEELLEMRAELVRLQGETDAEVVDDATPEELEHRALLAELVPRVAKITDEVERALFDSQLDAWGIDSETPARAYTLGQLQQIKTYLDGLEEPF